MRTTRWGRRIPLPCNGDLIETAVEVTVSVICDLFCSGRGVGPFPGDWNWSQVPSVAPGSIRVQICALPGSGAT